MRLRSKKVLTRDWDQLDPYELRERQLSRLRWFLSTRVIPFSAHYGKVFRESGVEPEDIRSFSDLARLPFTSKLDLLNTPENPNRARDFVLIPDEAVLRRRPEVIFSVLRRGKKKTQARLAEEFRPILMTATTGRSSDPVPFLYTQHDLDNLAMTGRRMMEVCNSKPEYRHLNLFPYAPHLAFWQMHYAGLGFNTFCLSSGGGKVMGTSGNVAMIKKIQPDALIGMPTFLYHVLQQAVCDDARNPNIQRIVLGGEKVPEGMRRKLKALCAELGSSKVEVISTYGFTEAKAAWPECPAPEGEMPSGFHLFPDLGLVEVIDPETGKPQPEGVGGEIVFTALNSRGTVVFRYRTGDYIEHGLTYEMCPHCGRRAPRLVGKISRVSNFRQLKLDKIKGTLVDFNELEHVLDDIDGIGAWQIELRKVNDDPYEADEIVVHASLSGDGGKTEMKRQIERRMRVATEVSPNRVEFHDAETLRRLHGVGENLKEEKVADHRPKAVAPEKTHNGSSQPKPDNHGDNEHEILEETSHR